MLVVANGGIDTHPDSGRVKLNIPTMHPNLSYIEDRKVVEQVDLAPELHKNSIRHLALGQDGLVAFGMQWQGGATPPPLVGLHRRGETISLLPSNDDMRGYIGSIAMSGDGSQIAVTSPRAGLVQVFDTGSRTQSDSIAFTDVSGVAPGADGFVITSGTGKLQGLGMPPGPAKSLMWDNHLVDI